MPAQSIINMANAMYAQQPQHCSSAEHLDAAETLLGVSPKSLPGLLETKVLRTDEDSTALENPALNSVRSSRRDRSDSAGLEALAFLATKETTSTEQSKSSTPGRWEESSSAMILTKRSLVASAVSSSSSSDDEAMPPPPVRSMASRPRCVSNPEGMDKWSPFDQNRLKFVLPASILEEEIAEATAAMKAKEEAEGDGGAADDDMMEDDKSVEEEIDEADLTPDELLRRARSRLLEDLSEITMNGEKGILALPHALDKYKMVYNKNGRIGIYTAAERAAIISRYQGKRTRRVWNKKIRYNCRKSLADRRVRVKGRFVKKEEQAKLASQTPTIPENDKFVSPEMSEEEDKESDMPDITDLEAGFCPTDHLPYRRTRRHTIT